jgi:hypothetical protein
MANYGAFYLYSMSHRPFACSAHMADIEKSYSRYHRHTLAEHAPSLQWVAWPRSFTFPSTYITDEVVLDEIGIGGLWTDENDRRGQF